MTGMNSRNHDDAAIEQLVLWAQVPNRSGLFSGSRRTYHKEVRGLNPQIRVKVSRCQYVSDARLRWNEIDVGRWCYLRENDMLEGHLLMPDLS